MLDEWREYIDLNNTQPKFQWWVYVLVKVALVAGALTIMALI